MTFSQSKIISKKKAKMKQSTKIEMEMKKKETRLETREKLSV